MEQMMASTLRFASYSVSNDYIFLLIVKEANGTSAVVNGSNLVVAKMSHKASGTIAR